MTRSFHSTTIAHPTDKVWATLRGFNGLATWFSGTVSESHIEDDLPDTTVGAIRSFQLGETRIREQLLMLDDIERTYAYEFCDPAPFPVQNYVAQLRVTPIADSGHCLVEWWGNFDCAEDERQHWERFFATEVFTPALESLRAYLGDA